MPLASPYTWNEQVKTIRLRSGAISRTDENSSQLQMVLFRRAAELNMLLTVRPEEERYGLSTGAGGVRTEQAVACTVGDAVLLGPRHSLRIVSVRRCVAEPGAAAHGGAARRALQERRTLGAGAVQVGTEGGVRRALGDLALEHPLHCADIVGVVCHVRKGIHPGEGCLHRDLVALGRAGLGEGNGAVGVFAHLCLYGMGGGTVGGIPVGGSPPAGSPELPPGVVSFSLVGSSEPRTRQVLHT